MVYLLHYDSPLHHAQHYLGSCDDPQRIQDHGAGTSRARLPQVFFGLGVKFVVAHTWEGGRTDERKLKNRKNARVLCPICRTKKLSIRAAQQRARRAQRKLLFPETSASLEKLPAIRADMAVSCARRQNYPYAVTSPPARIQLQAVHRKHVHRLVS